MNTRSNRTIVAQMVKRGSNHAVEFDRKFWADAGPNGRFAAAWEMVSEAALFRKEKDAGQQRLQRSVCSLQQRNFKNGLLASLVKPENIKIDEWE